MVPNVPGVGNANAAELIHCTCLNPSTEAMVCETFAKGSPTRFTRCSFSLVPELSDPVSTLKGCPLWKETRVRRRHPFTSDRGPTDWAGRAYETSAEMLFRGSKSLCS